MIFKQKGLLLASIVAVFLLCFSINATITTSTAFADYAPDSSGKCKDGKAPAGGSSNGIKMCADTQAAPTNPGQQSEQTGQEEDNEGVTCAVEKIGWILCPIIEGSGKMADWAFDFLADNFLQVEPELLTSEPKGGNGKGTITAWEYARNIANVMFVIAFVVVIYSQITGAGLNNYGIKRMLPRLIIGALAVNVSYYICQAMVDLSNLLGYNIKDAMSDIANQIGPSVMGQSNQGTNTQTTSTGGVLTLIAVGALAVAGLIWVMLPILGSMIAFILITCIVIIIILLLRKAFIILLVVVSPIAFVMYLLPNTEKYFSKWLNMFWQLLMVFPIVALLLGAGQLASTIILVAGTSQGSTAQQSGDNCDAQGNATNTNNNAPNQETVKTEGGYGVSGECTVNIGGLQSNWTLGLVAAGIAVAPLLAVWSVLQGALSAAGAIGGKITSAVQRGTSSGIGGAGKGLKSGYEKSAFGRGRALRKQGKEAYKNERFLQGLGDPNEAGSNREKMRRRYTRAAAGGLTGVLPGKLQTGSIQAQQAQIQRAAAAGAGLADKREKEEIQNEMAALNRAGNPIEAAQERLAQAIANNDKVGAKAAQNVLMSSGSPGMDGFVSKMAAVEDKANKELINALKQNALQNHGGTMKEKSGVAAGWASNAGVSVAGVANGTARDINNNPINPFGGLNDEQIAKQTSGSLKNALRRGWVTRDTAQRITTGSVGENLGQGQRQVLETYAQTGTVPPPPTPPTPPSNP